MISLFSARAPGLGLVVLALWLWPQAPTSAADTAAGKTGLEAGSPPTLPSPRSPVEFFRELLAMDPAEQRQHLAGRSPEKQKLLLEKIREYMNLTPNERELRLRSTELRYYLLLLMPTPATNRTSQLALVPDDLRASVESRLTAWDQIPSELQKELLEHEAATRHETESRLTGSTTSPSPETQDRWETAYTRWRLMPPTHRQAVLERFERFFALDAQEQANALKSVSAPERRQIEQTLRNFGSLSQAQRSECLRALHKYAELSSEERRQFLQDAERWKSMEPDHRQAWRDLVAKLSSQPPLPPGATSVPLPPMPNPPRQRITNGN